LNWLHQIRLVVLAVAFFGCGLASFVGASGIGERGYCIFRYGWERVSQEHLHVVYDRPTYLISNGDRASELACFVVFVLMLPVGFGLLGIGLTLIRKLTRLMGREVWILAEFRRLPPGPLASKRGFDLRHVLIAGVIFGFTAIIATKLFQDESLWLWLRSYALAVVAYSAALRLAFIGCPAPSALRASVLKDEATQQG
jgi:hypothetical protein